MSGTKISQIGTERTAPGTGTRVAASDTALPGQTLWMGQNDLRYWTGRKRVFVVGAGATLALTYSGHQDALIVLSSPTASFSFAPLTEGDGFRFEVVNISGVPFSVPAFAGATVRAAVSGHTQIANGGLTDFYVFTASATTYVYYANNTDVPAVQSAVLVATASLTVGVPPATAASTKTGSTVTATATLTPSSPATTVGSGSATLLAPITFEGTGAGANKVVTFGQAFPSGAVTAGTPLLVRRTSDSVAFRTQTDEKTYWGDGSLKHALMAVEVTNALADGSTLACGIWKNDTHASPGSTLDLAAVVGARTGATQVQISGAGTTYTLDLKTSIPSVTRWRSGPLVSEARITAAIPSASWSSKTSGRVVADLILTKDGDLFVDCQVANDSTNWPDVGVGSVTHSCQVQIDGTSVFSYSSKTLAWYSALVRLNGRTSGGSAATPWPLYVRHDPAYLLSAGASYRYDTTLGFDSSLPTTWNTARAGSTWNNILDGSLGLQRDMPMQMTQTGGRDDIGPTSDAGAVWLFDGNRAAQLYAMDQAETMHTVPWRLWDKTNARWLSKSDRNIRAHGSDGNFVPDYPVAYNDPNNAMFDADWTHTPAVMFVPYLLKGRRSVLDVLQAKVSYSTARMYDNGGLANFTSGAGCVLADPLEQTRGAAWNLRDGSWCAYLSPTSDPNTTYWSSMMAANAIWLSDRTPTWTSDQGVPYGYFFQDPATTAHIDTYYMSYYALALEACLMHGFTGYVTAATFQVNNFAGALLQSGDGFPLNAMAYYNMGKATPGGVYNTTWANYRTSTEAALVASGQNMSNNPANVDDTYSRLKAAGIATLKDRYPADTTVSGAWTYLSGLGSTLNGMSNARMKLNPKHNIVPSGFTRGP